jgi:copper chaperone CopZ
MNGRATLAIAALTVVAVITLAVPKPVQGQSPEPRMHPIIDSVRFTVKGMTCLGCEQHVKTVLKRAQGVDKAFVNYSQGIAVVYYRKRLTTPGRLRKVIEDAGYAVAPRQ